MPSVTFLLPRIAASPAGFLQLSQDASMTGIPRRLEMQLKCQAQLVFLQETKRCRRHYGLGTRAQIARLQRSSRDRATQGR